MKIGSVRLKKIPLGAQCAPSITRPENETQSSNFIELISREFCRARVFAKNRLPGKLHPCYLKVWILIRVEM